MNYEDFVKRQTFSPAEAGEILGIPANTIRSWLRRLPMVFTPDREAGEWRKLTADSILAMRVMQRLGNRGTALDEAARAIDHAMLLKEEQNSRVEGIRISLFGEGEVLALGFDSDGRIVDQRLLRTTDFDRYIVNHFLSSNVECTMFINLLSIKTEVLEGINKYLGWEA